MPARKSARRTKSKSFTKCRKRSQNACRKSSRCSYRADRSPKCQPKRSRRASRRRSSKRARGSRKKTDSTLGPLMSESELVSRVQKHICQNESRRPGEPCAEGCTFDRRMGCVPTAFLDDKMGKFLADGSRNLTFRSNKKPAFSFKMPLNVETLMGDYAGAIRFSPTSGKLVLCYGPIVTNSSRSTRPLLSTIVRESVAKNLWAWYQSTGRHMQRRRAEDSVDPAGNYYYADVYGLPGASVQLSWQEAMWLDSFLQSKFTKWKDANLDKQETDYTQPKSLEALSEAPSRCPPFLTKQNIMSVDDDVNCLMKDEAGVLKDASDKRKQRLTAAKGSATNPLDIARIDERLDDFDPFTSGSMNRRDVARSTRYGITDDDLEDLDMSLEDLDDIDDPELLRAILERKRRMKRKETKKKSGPTLSPRMVGTFKPMNVNDANQSPMGGAAHYGVDAELDKRRFTKRQAAQPDKTNRTKIKKEIEGKTFAFLGTSSDAPQEPDGNTATPKTGYGLMNKIDQIVTSAASNPPGADSMAARRRNLLAFKANFEENETAWYTNSSLTAPEKAQYANILKLVRAYYNAAYEDLGRSSWSGPYVSRDKDKFDVPQTRYSTTRAESSLPTRRSARYRGSNSSSESDSESD